MLDVIKLLLFLFAVYIAAPVVAGAMLIRLVFGWHNSRKDAILAFVFALPQCTLLHFGINTKIQFLDSSALYITLAATLLAVIFWLRAIRRTDGQYILVELAMVVIVPIILILSVDNWIVG